MIADAGQAVQTAWWGPALAFAAGLVSFASPCVLPLVPGYLAFVTGGEPVEGPRRRPVVPVVMFIAGFTVVFTVVFGFTASAVSTWIRSPVGQRVAGGLVLVFGVFMLMYAFRVGLPWLYREERPLLARIRPGPGWAFPLGMAFAAGWTPCIGPVLGGIVALASVQQDAARSVLLLFAYSMGLGVPFLLVGLGVGKLKAARFFTRHYHWFAGASGVLLVTIGVLLVSGLWVRVLSPLLQLVNRFTPPI